MKRIPFVPDTFVLGLVCMVLLAWLVPFEASTSLFPLSSIIYWGITLLFFLYGVKLKPKEIRKDVANWKLHLLIQSFTFLLFPLLILPLFPLFRDGDYFNLWLALLFLAALPSTVSSSVVMVSIAKGNVPAAIFNASLSGIIGLVATPLWMGMFLVSQSNDFSTALIAKQLFAQIVAPVTLGLLVNKTLNPLVMKYSNKVGWFDKTIIFLIIYKSFSNAFTEGVFTSIPKWHFVVLTLGIVALFLFVYHSLGWLSKKFAFTRADKITALFCGSKKSLVHGSVFVLVLIQDMQIQSLFLLPIMIYHAFQLLYTSIAARHMANESQQ